MSRSLSASLSASSVHAAMRCGFAFRPDVRTTSRPSGAAALFGEAVHAAVEAWLSQTEPSFERLSEDDQRKARQHYDQATGWLRKFGRPPEYVEQGLVYDVRRDIAAWGPRRGEDGYNTHQRGVLRGTLDMAWYDGVNGAAHVLDLKTGKVENAHVEQLQTLAVAVSRILPVTSVRVGFLFSRQTKVIEPHWLDMTRDDLDAWAGRLHRLMRLLPVAEPMPGDYCRWCEVNAGECPAMQPVEAFDEAI